ncbi:unnamed protein product [Peronospora belbahrii]|uniref:THIF-type NAD/FAD binding fold domain-containing protein n=1 Tax=Peronospora belbahrii TaxID=622444 RepID=A0AAU9KRZ8_9STRA|nr:unnamed protein product [Peronospora belbahrii]
MLVKKFGVKAQLKLQIAKVLLIGVGGLGSPAAMYLAAMGVDTLAIVDDDHVDRMYPMPAANALKLVGEYDVVVDASDNVDTRYLVNDACARSRKPLVSGSALGMEGQVVSHIRTTNMQLDATDACTQLHFELQRAA